MALTADQQQQKIILTVGDDAAGTLAANIALLWDNHDDVADLPLRAALTQRDAVMVMKGRVRAQVTFRGPDGSGVNLSDLSKHLDALLVDTDALIAVLQSGQAGSIAIGELTTTAPIAPDRAGQPDPNDRLYRGDALRRRGRRLP